ncbi:MAG: cell division protein FtsZ [Alistipes sp.]|nr:cell division protein FtsZ [Alistipes sp.]
MTDELMSEIRAPRGTRSIITVVGIGGAGGNAVNHMWSLGIRGVSFMVCNTDQQALDKSPVETKIRLGAEGLGAGNDPENGRRAAVETLPEIRQHFEEAGTRMLFITAGMGGGTGTGASPVIAKLAREMGLLTVAIVTSPLAVEGKIRYEQAFRGIEELRQNVDSLLIINNENILEIYGRLSLKQAFGKADDILASAAKGIAEIITVESDLVNVDFADVSKVMRNSGRAHMAVAMAEGGDRAEAVAEASLRSPLLDHNLISGAKNILLNISVANADELMYEEVTRILEYIQAHASVQDDEGVVHDANIIWGTSEKPQLGNAIELVVVATGFRSEEVPDAMKQIIPPARTVVQPVGVPEPGASVLEPIKPIAAKPAPPRPAEQVVLGAKSTRYSNIDTLLSKPAYQSRNSKFVEQVAGGRKKVLRDKNAEAPASKEDTGSGSLFD